MYKIGGKNFNYASGQEDPLFNRQGWLSVPYFCLDSISRFLNFLMHNKKVCIIYSDVDATVGSDLWYYDYVSLEFIIISGEFTQEN